jgi:hypothetical protein
LLHAFGKKGAAQCWSVDQTITLVAGRPSVNRFWLERGTGPGC